MNASRTRAWEVDNLFITLTKIPLCAQIRPFFLPLIWWLPRRCWSPLPNCASTHAHRSSHYTLLSRIASRSSMYIYICTYIHIYSHTYIYIYICIHVCIYVYMHICIFTYVYSGLCMFRIHHCGCFLSGEARTISINNKANQFGARLCRGHYNYALVYVCHYVVTGVLSRLDSWTSSCALCNDWAQPLQGMSIYMYIRP